MLRFTGIASGIARSYLTNVPRMSMSAYVPSVQNHIEISSMINRQICVPNALFIHNMREMLLKIETEKSEVDKLMNTIIQNLATTGLISMVQDIQVIVQE